MSTAAFWQKFLLTNPTENSWKSGMLQVHQNSVTTNYTDFKPPKNVWRSLALVFKNATHSLDNRFACMRTSAPGKWWHQIAQVTSQCHLRTSLYTQYLVILKGFAGISAPKKERSSDYWLKIFPHKSSKLDMVCNCSIWHILGTPKTCIWVTAQSFGVVGRGSWVGGGGGREKSNLLIKYGKSWQWQEAGQINKWFGTLKLACENGGGGGGGVVNWG